MAGARLISSADARADEIGGDEVRRELDPVVGAAKHGRERLHGQRLGQAGDALEQHVPAGKQADQQPLEHRVLTDDHPLDLVQRLLEGCARFRALVSGLVELVHLSSVIAVF